MLLSLGSYHSPVSIKLAVACACLPACGVPERPSLASPPKLQMHLITGDFSLTFPGRAQRAWRGQQQQRVTSSAVGDAAVPPRQYSCRRGFDAAAGSVVPLRRALEGFASPAGA